MSHEDQLSRKFEEIDFSDEPAMASEPEDDVRRGQRLLRHRRAVIWTAGLATGAVLATSAAVYLPSTLYDRSTFQIAGGPDSTPSAPATASPSQAPPPGTPTVPAAPTPTSTPTVPTPTAPADDPFPYPATRQLLLDTAVEHLDARHRHLPEQSTNVQGGGGSVGSKLDWTVPGEDGLGMVKVLVTSPQFDDGGDHALDGPQIDIGCGIERGESRCVRQPIPGTSGRAWVAPADPEQDLRLGVLYEREDGSLVGVAVYDLFGNNSTVAVSKVDISLQQAFAFVTDPDLHVVPGDDAGDRFPR